MRSTEIFPISGTSAPASRVSLARFGEIIVGRDRAFRVGQHNQVLRRDPAIAGKCRDHVDAAVFDGAVHERRAKRSLDSEFKPVGLPQRSPFRTA
jgi:hypothetical protein